jgi:hypothetical protein
MVIELVKEENIKKPGRQKSNKLPIQTVERQKLTNKPMLLKLLSIEDCCFVKDGCKREKSKREIDWVIRTENIEYLPKGNKRFGCKYYNIENRSCSVYKNRSCYGCKKKNFEKMTPRQKGYLKRFEK